MSNIDKTLNITPRTGMDLRALDKSAGSPFIQNTMPRNGEFMSRDGFGVVYQFGTTLDCGRINQTGDFGLGPCIGSTTYRTRLGQDHLVSVHPLFAYTGNLRNVYEAGASWTSFVSGTASFDLAGVSVQVHNLTTGRRYEFVLHSQDTQNADLHNVYPHYSARANTSTYGSQNAQLRWFLPIQTPKWVQFCVLDGLLLLSIDQCGVWTYRGVDGPVTPDRKNEALDAFTATPSYGETSALSPMSLTDGALVDLGTTYVQQSTFGTPQLVANYNNSAVYAVGNVLYFSDRSQPNVVQSSNTFIVPTGDDLTAMGVVRGYLFLATANQCWVYQPSNGALLSGGILTDMSNAVGCASNVGFCLADQGIFFVGRQGVWLYGGGLDLKGISDELDRLWTDRQSLQLPLTDYYQASGVTDLTERQPAARIDVAAQTDTLKVAWSQWYKTLFVTGDTFSLCWTIGTGWHLWNYETHAGRADYVKAMAGMPSPSIVTLRENVYMVAGPLLAEPSNTGTAWSATDYSCALLQYGRGGTTDRTVDSTREDARTFNGGWIRLYPAVGAPLTANGWMVGKPVEAPAGYVTANGQVLATKTVWFPVSVFGVGATFSIGSLHLGFDSGNWEPVYWDPLNPVNLDLEAIFPADRLGSKGVWKQGAGTPTNRIAVAPPKATTAQITIDVDGGAGGVGVWDIAPQIGVNAWAPTTLFWMGFKKVGLTDDYYPQFTRVASSIAGVDCNAYCWVSGNYPVQQYALGAMEQPVDWVVKSQTLVVGGNVFKLRGVFIRAMHLGRATTGEIVANWPFGPMNVATSTDYRDWSAQAIDFTSLPVGNSESTSLGTSAIGKLKVSDPQTVVAGDRFVFLVPVAAGGTGVAVQVVAGLNFAIGANAAATATNLAAAVTALVAGITAAAVSNVVTVTVTAKTEAGNTVEFVGTSATYGLWPLESTTCTGGKTYQEMLPTARLQPTSTATDLVVNRFDGGPTWGTTAAPATGNLLIGDAAVDTLATSDGSAGTIGSLMLHGTILHAGEQVRVGNVEAAVRVVGEHRRWHR